MSRKRHGNVARVRLLALRGTDFDVAVVGSGAGGGTLALRLARAGKRVALLERGALSPGPDTSAWEDRPVVLNGRATTVYAGGSAGGGTRLYGAALLRPAPADFAPGHFYGARLARELWDWPVSYAEFEPYFEAVEDDLRVAGSATPAPPHIGWRAKAFPRDPPPWSPLNRALERSLRGAGLRPFHLPLAIDFERCLRCARCPGRVCPTGARTTSLLGTERSARAQHPELWSGWEALRFLHRAGRVTAVRVHRGSRYEEIRAGHFVLAAGALASPALLRHSDIPDASGQLGRNHMCHLGALALGVFPNAPSEDAVLHKQIGLTDFYFGTPEMPHKLGYVQGIPVPAPDGIPTLPRWLSRLGDRLSRHVVLLAGSIEDLPCARNRVAPLLAHAFRLERRFDRYDALRARWLARQLGQLLRRAGAIAARPIVAHRAHRHVAHQVGTCRFGRDPRHSELDPHCRVHGIENRYVVDGSFMPTSLGVGPALTIMANALRVADHLERRI